MLEIYVRALVVNHASIARLTPAYGRKSLEAILEEKRNLSFKALIDSLVSVGLFDNEDGERAKTLYDNVRIPLFHGLPRRFVRKHQEPDAEEFSQLFKGETAISSRELEGILENHALEYLEGIVGIIEKKCLLTPYVTENPRNWRNWGRCPVSPVSRIFKFKRAHTRSASTRFVWGKRIYCIEIMRF